MRFSNARMLAAQLVFAALCGLGIAVAGAAPADEYRIKLSVPAGQGIVALRVVTNRVASLFGNHRGRLYLRNLETRKEFTVPDTAPPYFLESLYIGALPPGDYEPIKLESTQGALVTLTTQVPISPNPGSFHVAAQRVTDLGTAAFVGAFRGGTYAFSYEPAELSLNRVRVLLDPASTQALEGDHLSWDPPGAGVTRPRLDGRTRQVTQNLLPGSRTSDGTLLFGESFGQIGVRLPQGSWSAQQTPAIDLITGVAWATDGTIAASSEEGGVWLRGGTESASWRARWLPRADAMVHYVAFDNTQRLLAVAETSSAIIVYSLAASSDTWSELHTFALESNVGPGIPRYSGASLDSGTLKIFTRRAGAFKMESSVNVLSLADGSAHTDTTRTIGEMRVTPGGMLYTMSGPNPAQSLYISKDGATWDKRGSPNWTRVVRLRTDDRGYALRIDHALVGSGPVKTSFWATSDGGRTWSRTEAPDNSQDVILLDDPKSLLVATSDGRLFRSMDDGSNWQLEKEIL